MFESLKKKLKGWLGKEEKVQEKPAKSVKTKSKKGKKEAGKNSNVKKEKILENIGEIKPAVEETEKEEKEEQVREEVKEEKKGFFSKLFGKKEESEEAREKKKEEAKQKILESLPEEEKQTSFFSKISAKFTTSTVKKEQIDEIFQDLEIILLENNVALEVVDKIKENLIKDLEGIEVKKGRIEETVLNSLKSSIESVLLTPPDLIKQIKESRDVFTIIFFGINGTGKTTTIAKLAHLLQKNHISVVLAAADTFRAAAIEQLETHAKNLKVPIIKSEYNADPTSVAFEAKKYAQAHNIKCILIDTAGRMYTKENLMKQMEKIIRVIQPNLKLFIGESITGHDAIEQAKTFNETAGIDGIILSKADVDEKGGTALSVSFVTGKPIYFLGTGQGYDDLEVFSKEKIIKNLGLG